MPIDVKLWGVQGLKTPSCGSNAFGKINTTGWPIEHRPCRICGRMTDLHIHPEAHAEWLDHKDDSDAEYRVGVILTRMALKGATCDNCSTTREMFLKAREGVMAVAIELLRAQGNDGSNLTDKQEERLMLNLNSRLKRYSDALRRMNDKLSVIWDERFVTLIWNKPQGAWLLMRGMVLYLYQGKSVDAEIADILQWIKRVRGLDA